ncbi:juvenile hormone acid O-methyltransferase-like [Limulus polyphemus]|uniref:Juvenile hormone acid O-methyltransferase-like n=1 Tax=Limulus polyphemus TaxID=6850 RepID=A0ABM1TR00_LIMPO|nr:juvenile hormone acid O-methyltransferase-like [Limulus polyphemus]
MNPHEASTYSQLKLDEQIKLIQRVYSSHVNKMTWTDTEYVVLDIGCATGDVTKDILLPLCPDSVSEIIAIDILPEMINFAENHYPHQKIRYKTGDIKDRALVLKQKSKFQKTFSSFSLNMIFDHQLVLQNVNYLLSPGGEFSFIIVATGPQYKAYEELARSTTWEPYMKDWKNFITPMHYWQEIETEYKTLASKCGFAINDISVESLTFGFPGPSKFKSFLNTISPFVSKIPDDKTGFIEDTYRLCLKHGAYQNPDGSIQLPLKILSALATKFMDLSDRVSF